MFLRNLTGNENHKVDFVELFFDLVFVFAVTQLAHFLLHHFSWIGLLESTFLLLALWWVWIFTSWVTNWLDPHTTPVRLMMFAMMLGGLVLAISLPEAFGERGLIFACAFVAMQVGRSLFTVFAMRGHHDSGYRNFQRITIWLSLSAVFWIAGGLSEHNLRWGFWLAALAIEYAGPSCGFRVPGLGVSTTSDWRLSGEHLAERCGLFIIIALGESLLVTGAVFAEIPWTIWTISAFLTAFITTLAVWWIYFNVGAEHASKRIAKSDDPGRIARRSFTYLHLPIVAGIILMAVSDEFILAHPDGHIKPFTALAIIGGPALFLFGSLVFKRSVFGKWPTSHVAGIVLLALSIALIPLLAPLGLAFTACIILIGVGVWEHMTVLHPRSKHARATGDQSHAGAH